MERARSRRLRAGAALAALLLAGGLAPVRPAAAAAKERLVYAIVHKGAGYEAGHTEIYSLDLDSGERRLLFTDEGSPIVLLQRLYVFHFPVVGGHRIYAHGAERGAAGPVPGNGAIYEISTDGSGTCRKIARVAGEESVGDLCADPKGTRVGYIARLKRRHYLFLHDTSTGSIARKVDVTGMILDCVVSALGWDPRSGRLYLSAESGDSDITSEASYARAGTYVFDEAGVRWTKIASLPPLPGFHPPESARMIGTLPDGRYVFETMQLAARPASGPARFSFSVESFDPATGRVGEIGFHSVGGRPPGGRLAPILSPSGVYLAGATPPGATSARSQEIWVKDLRTGVERMPVSIPCEGAEGPFLGLVGWLPR